MCTFDLFFGGELFSLPFGLYRVRLRLSDGLAALTPQPPLPHCRSYALPTNQER